MRTRRALLYTEHIGSHQYRLRIRNNNPYNVKQWWVFDYRTKTIRASSNRNFVISVQKGGTNWKYYSYAGVVYRYTGHMLQKIRWFNRNRRTIKDISGRCLYVSGNSDSHNRHTLWSKCNNYQGQGWLIDRRGYNYPRFPIRSGVRFQMKIRMKYQRPIYWAQKTSYNQYYLKIRDNFPANGRQWFVWDGRTNTIRAWSKRSHVVANYYNQRFNNYYAMLRPYRQGDNTLQIRWYNRRYRNMQNNGRKCFSLQSYHNSHNRYVYTYACSNRAAQSWFLTQVGERSTRQPLADGKRFIIRSRQSGGKAVEVSSHIGGHQYRLIIKNFAPFTDNQWFVFDRRSRTVRAWKKRNYAISNLRGKQ